MSRLMQVLIALSCVAWVAPAQAEKADRDKPVNLESDKLNMDDARKVAIFEGRVVLTQGTLVIRGDKMVVTQDAQGFQRGVVTGNPARLRQKREGVDDYIEGEALRIDYDARTDKADFFDKAWIRSGQDEVRGQTITYDGASETYVASGGSATGSTPGSGRVRVVIQPKSRDEGASAPAKTPSTQRKETR